MSTLINGPSLALHGKLHIAGAALCAALDIHVPATRWTCILGASGCGKSTIGRLLAGLPTPAAFDGTIAASDGLPIDGRVAWMGQNDQLLPWANILTNVMIGAKLRGDQPDVSRARSLLEAVGLGDLMHRKPAELSGGQRQRVALARTLMEDRPILFLDEPFSALDASTRSKVQDLSLQLLRGKTVILVTHDPLEAARMADTAWLLAKDNAYPITLPKAATPRSVTAPETLQTQAMLLQRMMQAEGSAI